MKNLLLISVFVFLSNFLFSQNSYYQYDKNNIVKEKNPKRTVIDNGLNGVTIEYNFSGFSSNIVAVDNENYNAISIKDFAHLKEIGKPDLPSHNDIIAIPEGANATIQIISFETVEVGNQLIFPALEPASDEVGAPEPEFTINKSFYKTNTVYPAKAVEINKINKYRNIQLATISINPIQYNPKLRKLIAYKNIKYKIVFSNASQFFDKTQHSAHALNMIPNLMLNNGGIKSEINTYLSSRNGQKSISGPSKDYIIITHDDYCTAADSLAQWKRKLGYSVEVVSRATWTASDIENEVHQRYQNWTPKPDYVVIIGDHDKTPGKIISNFASDLYVVCMNGSGDYYPDMAKGRISVSSATEAMTVVDKIIEYEKNPPTLASYYTNALNCAYFQESSTTGYAERRFAQTSEDIRDYTNGTLGYNVSRVYVTGSSTSPTNWNNGNYSAGEALPSYLLKPGFAWDGNATDINNAINSGVFYVFHRDHGDVSLWGDPYYTTSNINSLTNGNLTPVVFSINCLTGKFLESECFSEKFLRKSNGGAVGVFCHAEVSYSGYNDGLALGLIDAIWSSPGLVPNFTGSGGVSSPTLSPHSDIFTMGDVANQGLIRMVETWGDNQYTHQLFHYFGDPAMKIWTQQPTTVTATHQNSINCTDNTFTINSSSLADGLATLVIDGLLVGEVQLSGGTGVINIPTQLTGNYAWLTISKHNYQPYTVKIPITGNCINAQFSFTPNSTCLSGDDIVFTNSSSGPITTYDWNFGSGASPATANTVGPHTVTYSTSGWKYITLTVHSSTDVDTFTDSIYVDPVCGYNMPNSGTQTLTSCTGILYDNGGQGNYTSNIDATTTISVAGAVSLTLDFTVFNIEAGSGSTCDYDYINIYDGPNTSSTLLGKYCNTTGSPGTFTTSGSDVTIVQHSDQNVEYDGFEVHWQCNSTGQAPVVDFSSPATNSCSANVSFTDLSTNVPTVWTWYFGDGTTSPQQNPTHSYASAGTYTVKLVSSNPYGADSLTKTNYITISSSPTAPTVSSAQRCSAGQLTLGANGSGTINWYDTQTSTTVLGTGNNYTTPIISSSSVYYAENMVASASSYGGSINNNSNGSFYTSAYQHGLYFDCTSNITILSVEVNADSSGNRTIELQNSSGTVLDSRVVNIPMGISRINLNFNVPAGSHYKLAGPTSPYLYRNNSGNSYPYAVGTDVSITGCDASSPTGYYYYFYNWEVSSQACYSSRVAVNADIVLPSNVTITANGSTALCNGGTVGLTAPTGALSYLWHPTNETTQNITANTIGNFYVDYIIDSCSISSNTINVTSQNNAVAGFAYSANGLTVDFTNQSQYATTYNWEFGDGGNSTLQDPTHTYSSAGTYTVALYVNNNCGADTIFKTINVTTVGLSSAFAENGIIIYPNPAHDYVIVESRNLKVESYAIYDVAGRNLTGTKLNKFSKPDRVDISNLQKGVYFIKLQTENGQFVGRFVKE